MHGAIIARTQFISHSNGTTIFWWKHETFWILVRHHKKGKNFLSPMLLCEMYANKWESFISSSMWIIFWLQESKPLHSFEDNSDYILDAKWSPIHPALFATVDCNGRLDMWNLNNDTEVKSSSRQRGSADMVLWCWCPQGNVNKFTGEGQGMWPICGSSLSVPSVNHENCASKSRGVY